MMKRKVRLGALLAVSVLMLALLIGGLYGFFEDTEDGSGNTFTAGILDLEAAVAGTTNGADMDVFAADPPNSVAGHVEFGNVLPGIAPGDGGGTITWTLTNAGNVNGNASWSVGALAVTNDENTLYEPEDEYGDVTPAAGELGVAMDVDIDVSTDGGATWTNQYSADLDGLAGLSSGSSQLNPGDTVLYRLTWSVPDSADPYIDNLFQSDIAAVDIVFTLTQA